jgi:acyl-coenzyme A thioesterase PaaI-like protein
MTSEQSIQARNFADGECFGCGPSNAAGFRIKSFPRADGTVVAQWSPGAEHSNGAGAVCGGVLGTILDCHCAAAASVALSATAFTKEFTIEFLRPTPLASLELVARVVERRNRSVALEAVATASGEVCVRFRGVFVVPRNKPAS